MSIKKSYLERKWYYRVAKVFFLILPFLVAVILLNKKIIFFGISQKNIAGILQGNILYIIYIAIGLVLYFLILKAIWKIFLYIAFGGLEDDTIKEGSKATQSVNPATKSVAPLIILLIFFAIAALFQMGYIKLPKINPNPEESSTSGESNHTYGTSCKTSDGKKGLYGKNGTCYTCSDGTAVTNPINNNCSNGISGVYCCSSSTSNDGNKTTGCVPTGCGSLWYCSGTYYFQGVQLRANGCYPSGARPGDIYSSWSGTCRQCP